MTSRTVVTRKRRVKRTRSSAFQFTKEMVPGLSDGPATQDPQGLYRQNAWEIFEKTPLPTTRDEPWRRTNLRNLEADSFRLADKDAKLPVEPVPEALLQPLVGDAHGGLLVQCRGDLFHHVFDSDLEAKGVIFTDFNKASRRHPDQMRQILGQVVQPDEGYFAALSGSLSQNGVLVYVPDGVRVEKPLHSVLWGPGTGLAHFSHILVWLGDGAELTYVHESASPTTPDGQTLHGGIVEMHVGAGANLTFVELQSWGKHVWNFTHERARVQRDGQLDWIFGGLGTNLTKSFLDMDLDGQGSSGRMSGFFFTDGNQHLDLDTQQNHHQPNTTSDLLYKGALEGNSRTVWQGMIYVAPGAQKTDGYQANRNLVLSTKARADSIPGLEILADDVRCTHGATVGKMEEELLFYLRSRGLTFADAKRLVVEGFFDPIMQRIPFEGVRDRFQMAILEKLIGKPDSQ